MNGRFLLTQCGVALMLGACLSMVFTAYIHNIGISAESHSLEQPSTQLSAQQVRAIATGISVKVLSEEEVLGSGFLIQQQGQNYTVLTNEHVLITENPSYRIQTPDGRIYKASKLKNIQFQDNDIALLKFRSERISYRVASIDKSWTVVEGQEVFAAGFAIGLDSPASEQGKFEFASGRISLVLDKALQGGYQLGYTNDIKKGMSGGPLLNRWGKVIGVNGKHAYPLWNAPSMFQDGSQVCPTLNEIINSYSWAVPIGKVVQLTSKFIEFNNQDNLPDSTRTPLEKISNMLLKNKSQNERLNRQRQTAGKNRC